MRLFRLQVDTSCVYIFKYILYNVFMNNLNTSQIKSISSLQRDYASLVENVKDGNDIVFFKRNVPYVVMIDFEKWQEMIELKNKVEEKIAIADIMQSEKEFAAGNFEKLESLADL